MIKILLLIFLILLSIFFFTNRILKNFIKNPLLRLCVYGLLILIFLLTILLARFESVDSSNGTYTPPFYDGNKINPGIVEYE